MAKCVECNSVITEGEPFCGVCGLAVPKTAAPVPATPETEDPFEGTIVMAPNELAQAAGLNKPKSEPNVDPTQAESTATEPTVEAESVIDPNAVPTPAILDKATSESLDVRSTADYKLEKGRTSGSIDTGASEFVDFGLPETQTSVATDAPAVDHDATTAKTPLADLDESYSEASESPSPEPISEIHSSGEPMIAKPDDDLPVNEFASSNPIYDSVRIVAPDVPESQDFVATRIPTQGNLSSKFPDPTATQPTKAEPRAYTSPNIGEGDTDGRRSAKLRPLTEGAVLNGRYEIIRKIGGGGMGAVYLASDNNLGGVLRAVKEMIQAHIEEEQQEKAINDFKRESMILSSLDHPSIPTIFDYFYDEAESRFYLVMKYISGGDLSARIRSAPEGKIDELTVTEWALQIIDVLNYLHNQPSTIVYRDLKPSNIMIDSNSGRVMLIDFGIARSISQREEKGVTAVGTMGYAPPELFSGNVEPRSDIYSLGSTMFHLLTGADPQSNPLLIFDFQKNPRPRQINPRLSDQMERILMRSVEYNAEARFGSAGEMRQVLEQHLANLRSGNITYGVTEAPEAVSLENQIVFCGFCGQRIVATDMFCAFCGAKQPIAQHGVHSGVYTKATVTARLLIEGTTELTMPAFSLQKDENLLGRRDPMSNIFPEIDLSKYDPQTKISRRHARIWRDGGNFLVEDLGSSNGTVLSPGGVDAVRLTPHRPQMLANGDKIKLGDTTLHFVVE